MPQRKSLSEASQWFLRDFQKLLDSFAKEKGIQVVVVNKDGEFISEIYGVQRACKLIIATDEGKTRCEDHFRSALSLVRSQRKPIFTECYAGFASVWIPIIIKGGLIGAIIGCGGLPESLESRERLKERFSRLVNELLILQKDDFFAATLDEASLVSKEDLEKRAQRLEELFDILAKTAHTPIKEVFG